MHSITTARSPPGTVTATGPAPRTAFPSSKAEAMISCRPVKGLLGGLPSSALPGSRPWGRRSASRLSGLSAFPLDSGLFGTPFGPSLLITLLTIFTLYGADDGLLGLKAWHAQAKRRGSAQVTVSQRFGFGTPCYIRNADEAARLADNARRRAAVRLHWAAVLSRRRRWRWYRRLAAGRSPG